MITKPNPRTTHTMRGDPEGVREAIEAHLLVMKHGMTYDMLLAMVQPTAPNDQYPTAASDMDIVVITRTQYACDIYKVPLGLVRIDPLVHASFMHCLYPPNLMVDKRAEGVTEIVLRAIGFLDMCSDGPYTSFSRPITTPTKPPFATIWLDNEDATLTLQDV